MSTLPLVIFALVLAGCSSSAWVKPGAGEQEYAVDSYECRKENEYLADYTEEAKPVNSNPVTFAGGLAAQQASKSRSWTEVEVDRAGWRACMQARGWRWEKVED